MYKKKDVILTGFALFAMLFGAGNLIFPPVVGFTNGNNWVISGIGFILTGAGFPLLAIIAAAVAGKDLDSFATRVSPLFSKIFNIALILSIGPLLALPRTGATAFEMMVPQNIENFQIYKFGFLTIFFAITILFSLKSSKVVDRVGAILTPILLAVLAIIIFKGVFSPIGTPKVMGAAIVFSEIILKSIRKGRNLGAKDEFSFLVKASFIAIGGLTIVYGGLVYIGGTATGVLAQGIGSTELLSTVVTLLLGNIGKVVLGICVAGACLTTAIGLTATVADYFSGLLKIAYEKLVIITVVISFIFASFGVDVIVKLAVPVLVFIYPISIALIFLNFMKNMIKNDNVYIGTVVGTGIVSACEAMQAIGINIELINTFYSKLPLDSLGLSWVLPGILGGIIFSFFKKH